MLYTSPALTVFRAQSIFVAVGDGGAMVVVGVGCGWGAQRIPCSFVADLE